MEELQTGDTIGKIGFSAHHGPDGSTHNGPWKVVEVCRHNEPSASRRGRIEFTSYIAQCAAGVGCDRTVDYDPTLDSALRSGAPQVRT